MAIQNEAIFQKTTQAIFNAPIKKLGARKQSQTSRDMMKPANTAALFIYGGEFEIHASRTSGRMTDHIWCYHRGVLAHEGVDPVACQRVIGIADKIISERAA